MAHYKIQALEVGYDEQFPAGIAFDFWYMGDKQVYSPFSVVLIQGEGHKILLDCGIDVEDPFAIEKMRMENDKNCHGIEEVLNSIGLDAGEIDSVILSHCHWDHIGGMQALPNAKFYVQRAEVENWERVLSDPSFPRTHTSIVNPEYIRRIRRLAGEGRVEYLYGDVDELFPGISLAVASGHSFAQSMLFINNGGEHFAAIGDVAMRPESFKGCDAFPGFLPNLKFTVGKLEDITASYHRIMKWVRNDVTHIIPAHDGTLQNVWPTVRSSLGLNVTTIAEA